MTRRGFTFVELMVVVGVLGVLIALVLPLQDGVRRNATTITCLNNQRQIAQAVIAYAGRFDRKLPITIGWGTIQGNGNYLGWVRFLVDAKLLPDPLLPDGSGINESSVFACPSKREFIGAVRTDFWQNAASDYAFTLLGGNACTGDFEKAPNPWKQMDDSRWLRFRTSCGPYTIDEIKHCSETAMLADAQVQYQNSPAPQFSSKAVMSDVTESLIGSYFPQWELPKPNMRFPLHGGCVNVTFMDGHGQTVRCPVPPADLQRMLSPF